MRERQVAIVGGAVRWRQPASSAAKLGFPPGRDARRRQRIALHNTIEKAPSLLFIDEFEAFLPARSELGSHPQFNAEEVNEFLANLEGCAER
jgi:hypothetical protein